MKVTNRVRNDTQRERRKTREERRSTLRERRSRLRERGLINGFAVGAVQLSSPAS